MSSVSEEIAITRSGTIESLSFLRRQDDNTLLSYSVMNEGNAVVRLFIKTESFDLGGNDARKLDQNLKYLFFNLLYSNLSAGLCSQCSIPRQSFSAESHSSARHSFINVQGSTGKLELCHLWLKKGECLIFLNLKFSFSLMKGGMHG